MDTLSHFHTLDELIRALDRERRLLSGLFQDRKRLSFRYDVARELAARRDESLEFLRRFGVIRDNGDFVELEDVYLKFFEDVLEVNEEINVSSVKESIDATHTGTGCRQTDKHHCEATRELQPIQGQNQRIQGKLQCKEHVQLPHRTDAERGFYGATADRGDPQTPSSL